MAQGGDISATLKSAADKPSAADEAVFERLQTSLAHMANRDNTGRWTNEEHDLFLHCLKVFGKDWKKFADVMRTRSVIQIRTHAQKYFQKVARETGAGKLPESTSCRSSFRKIRMCRQCRGHGVLVALQGHSHCPYAACTCSRCFTNKGTKRNTRNDAAYEAGTHGHDGHIARAGEDVPASQLFPSPEAPKNGIDNAAAALSGLSSLFAATTPRSQGFGAMSAAAGNAPFGYPSMAGQDGAPGQPMVSWGGISHAHLAAADLVGRV